MRIHQITPFGWRLGLDSPYRRKPDCPENLQDEAFRQQFDYTTVFYDVFFSPEEEYAVCICPPFFNLEPYIEDTAFFAATSDAPDKLLSCPPLLVNQDRCAEIWLTLPPGKSDSLVCRSPLGTFRTRIGENYCRLFAGKRVLVTTQKNNKPEWIADWININKALHGVNAVLLFDNGSSVYSRSELVQYLAGCVSLAVLAIVDWPYLYGPLGCGTVKGKPIPWDLHFTQHAILQAAHWRFLAQAEAVLQCDIDEIMIADDCSDIVSKAAAAPGGVLLAASHFVGSVTDNGITADLPPASGSPGRRGSDFFRDAFVLADEGGSHLKYVYIPSSILIGDQLRVHIVRKADGSLFAPHPSVAVYHFKRVNTGWKPQGRLTTLLSYNQSKHYFDCILVKALVKAEKNMPGYDYPLKDVLAFAKKIGACPHPEGASPPRCPATDCSICPYNGADILG